eukprot:TRINITY_DN8849_c0_g1_i1.p1 TRINITY_DN8849_c0_g1~~TRINITY_DN8849_c0_g1_i1.p1  ORF type:complete len:297 (+),score=88.62 TRINITY_DN8849_c0_g1_i1:36-926(+)
MVLPVLVPLDGSDSAQVALLHALRLARTLHAPVRLLHVVGGPGADGAAAQGVLDAACERARGLGVTATGELAEAGGRRTAEVIVEAAAGAQLVLMGTHGAGTLDRLVLGSVCNEVVRAAAVPVCAVRYYPGELHEALHRRLDAKSLQQARVCVALDGSEAGVAAMGPVVALAAALGADVTLVTVVSGAGLDTETAGTLTAAEVHAHRDRAAAEARRLDEAAAAVRAQAPTLAVTTEVLWAAQRTVAAALAAAAQGFDFVAVAAQRRGLARAVLGSTAEELLRLATVPVIVVRAAAA